MALKPIHLPVAALVAFALWQLAVAFCEYREGSQQ